MLFIMLQNSFKATKHKKRAEAKSGNARHRHQKCAGNTIFNSGQHNTREVLEMNTKLMTKGKSRLWKTKQRLCNDGLILSRIQAGAIHGCDKGGHAVHCCAT